MCGTVNGSWGVETSCDFAAFVDLNYHDHYHNTLAEDLMYMTYDHNLAMGHKSSPVSTHDGVQDDGLQFRNRRRSDCAG
jgi:hypothetical protein